MDIEITGNYPIILDGETAGELTVTREGLFWSFDAKCELRSEIVRLSVYGDGKEGYLGIMEPFGEMLKLNRKFSRAALKDFPSRISHAGQKGELEFIGTEVSEIKQEPVEIMQESTDINQAPQAPSYSGEFPQSCYIKDESEPPVPPEDNKPPPEESEYPLMDMTALDWRPCALPCSLFSGIREKRVCSNITGAFIAQLNGFQLLAVPEDIALSLPKDAIHFVDEINFSDEKFMICIIKNGRSVLEF